MSTGCVVQFDTDSAIALPQVSRLPLQVFFSFTLRARSLTRAFSRIHRNWLVVVVLVVVVVVIVAFDVCMSVPNVINLICVCVKLLMCVYLIFLLSKNLIVYKRLSTLHVTYIIIILWFYFTHTNTCPNRIANHIKQF